MKMTRIGFAVIMLVAASCTTMKNSTLVQDGQPASCIILQENADPIEKHAAAELALFIKKASGAEVRIGQQAVPGLCPIRLGTDAKLEGVTDQGFVIKTDGKGLSITGKKPIGVLYGAYDFLEKQVGCRWFAPYDDCEYVPQVKTIKVAANTEDRQSPSFEYRAPWLVAGDDCAGNGARKTWDWMIRNKMQIIVTGGPRIDRHYDFLRERGAIINCGGTHLTFTESVPDAKYFKTHPEYFCLVDGKRVPQGVYGPGCVEAQVCTSNPDVVRLCAEHIMEGFNKYPDSFFALGAGDNGSKGNTKWCECANCVKLDPPGSKSISTRYAVFANAVAKVVREKNQNPQSVLWLWGYTQYREPPVGVTIDPELTVQLFMHNRNYKEPLATGPSTKKYLELMQGWRKLAKRVIIHEFFGCSTAMTVCPTWDTLAADLRLYHASGVIGWIDFAVPPDAVFSEINNTPDVRQQWRSYWQRLYLASKMLWDVNLDEKKVLAEARALYYGKAAPAMEKYYATLCDAWQKAPGTIGWGAAGNTFTMGRCMALPGVRAELAKQLAEAAKLAGDDAALQHKIKEEQFFYEEYWLKKYDLFVKSNIENPTLTPTNAVRPIVLDGRGTDKQWLAADYSKLLLIKPDGDKNPANETFVRIMYDEKNIYFLVEAMEKDVNNLKANCAKRDDPAFWNDDSVEIFLYNQKEWGRYWQFCVNPKGVVFDSECASGITGDPKFDADTEIKTAMLPDRWIVEARIPAGALGQQSFEGAGWKVNVCRGRQAKGASDPGELSSLTGYNFHDFERFRPLGFGKPLIGNGSFDAAVEASTNASLQKWEIKGGKIPAKWDFHGTGEMAELIMRNPKTGDLALNISNGWIFQTPAFQWSAREKSLVFSVEAKGTGNLKFAVFRYKSLPTSRTKSAGLEFLRTDILKNFDINSAKWHNYECAYEVPDGEFFALVFMVKGSVSLDNAVITPAPKASCSARTMRDMAGRYAVVAAETV